MVVIMPIWVLGYFTHDPWISMAIGFLGHGHGLTSAMARDQRRSTMAIVLEVDFDFLILFERHNYIFTIIFYLFI
jgi:hypothetical protein